MSGKNVAVLSTLLLLLVFAASANAETEHKRIFKWESLPELPKQTAGAFVGVSNGAVIIAGGEKQTLTGKGRLDDIFVLADGAKTWISAGKLKEPVAQGAAVSTSQGVICIGGRNKTGDVRYRRIIKKLQETGEWNFSYEIILLIETDHKGTFAINTQRQCGVDGTSEESLTEAMIQARREIAELMKIFKKYVPGFQNSRMTVSAPMIGVRETRRIVGEYTLSIEDLGKETHHKDTIALSGFGWDLPHPKKPTEQPMWTEKKPMALPYTEIPYRSLVPKGVENLIVAGRCVSVERDALGPIRVQPACSAMGQAAGIAAAWSAAASVPMAEIDTDKLRKRLVENGAIVSSDAKTDTELLEKWQRIHAAECSQFGEQPKK